MLTPEYFTVVLHISIIYISIRSKEMINYLVVAAAVGTMRAPLDLT